MGTSINSYSVGFGMDAASFIDGAKISRSETRKLISDINAARQPLEQFEQAQNRIAKAYEAGAISSQTANRLIDAAAEKYGLNAEAAQKLANEERILSEQKKRAETITMSVMTAEEKHSQVMAELSEHLQAGRIDFATYSRAQAQAIDTLNNATGVTSRLAEEERERNAVLARGRLITQQYLTPAERFQQVQLELNHLLSAGAIDQATFTRAVEAARPVVKAQTSTLESLSRAGNVVTGSYFAITSAMHMLATPIRMVNDLWREFDELAQKLDDANDKAHKLGVTFNDIGGLTFAAGRLGGADAAAALDKALGQMLKRGMVQSGETAADAFMRVAEQVKNAATQTERAKIASDAFGKSGIELLAVLQAGSGEIGDMLSQWSQFNGLTEQQIEALGRYNDTWEDIALAATGLKNQLVVEMAPALTVLGQEILSLTGGFDDVAKFARDAADALIVSVVATKELAEINARIVGASLMPFKAVELLSGIENPMTKAVQALNSVYEERNRLQEQFRQRESQQTEEIVDNAESAKTRITQDFNAEFEAMMTDFENKFSTDTQNALQQAKQYFADEQTRLQKMRQDMAQSPASMDPNSAEYVKFRADLMNKSLVGLPDSGKPTDEQVIEKATQLLIENQKQTTKMAEQVEALKKLVVLSENNQYKRIR